MDRSPEGSVRSIKTTAKTDRRYPRPSDGVCIPEFEEYLPAILMKLQTYFSVVVQKEFQKADMRTHIQNKPKSTKSRTTVKSDFAVDTSGASASLTRSADVSTHIDPTAIVITALHNAGHQLAELSMSKLRKVPRKLIQAIGFLAPFYPVFSKISIRHCGIDGYTLYELNNWLPLSSLTEVCLDDSPLPEANYGLLLSSKSKLKNLSLCRCRINDAACQMIAENLHQGMPAATSLGLLNLTSNQITDTGAMYLGTALRSNRTLRYLNLSGNRITDTGAIHILNVLMEFPLTYEETIYKKSNYFAYLRKRQSLYQKFLDMEFSSADDDSIENPRLTNRKSDYTKKAKKIIVRKDKKEELDLSPLSKTERMVNDLMGPFDNAFRQDCVVIRNGFGACLGNLTLTYLNLAYNNISYLSVKTLLAVFNYQILIQKGGLMKVVIDGNDLPWDCEGMRQLTDIMVRLLGVKRASEVVTRRKTTTSKRADTPDL